LAKDGGPRDGGRWPHALRASSGLCPAGAARRRLRHRGPAPSPKA